MRWLGDENFPRVSVGILRETGLDVRWMAEAGAGAPDTRVMEEARTEGRGLLTFDRDFGELVFREGLPAPPVIVYLRFVPRSPEEPARMVQNLLATARRWRAGSSCWLGRAIGPGAFLQNS